VKPAVDRVWDLVGRNMAIALGPNPSQELFRFATFATSMLVFGLQEEKMRTRDEFKLCYDSVYPEGQAWLPCGGANAPAAMGDAQPNPRGLLGQAAMRPRAHLLARRCTPHDPRRECFVLQQQVDVVHSTPPTPTRAPRKVSPPRSAPPLVMNPRRTRLIVNGSVLTSTRLRRLSRTSRRGFTTCSAQRLWRHLCASAHKRYVVVSSAMFTGLLSPNGPPRPRCSGRTPLGWPQANDPGGKEATSAPPDAP
jgi:hypothetical protein